MPKILPFGLLSLPFDTLTGMEKEGGKAEAEEVPSYPLLSSFLPLFLWSDGLNLLSRWQTAPPPKKNP